MNRSFLRLAVCTTLVLISLSRRGPGVDSTAHADEKLAGIACRSVHLAYPAPRGSAFCNEVTVERSAPGTYFCVCGFNGGYFGIQELASGKKVAIFSVWDPGKQDDARSVPDAQRVKLVASDPETRVGRFGGEGTGGQSFLNLDWKPGQTYRFLVTGTGDGSRMTYTAYLASPDRPAWRMMASFSTPTRSTSLSGYYSFIEDFRRNRVSATQQRVASFGPAWVRVKSSGEWQSLGHARFTADSNPSLAIDAGPDRRGFFLATGGPTRNDHVKLRDSMKLEVPVKDKQPAGDLPPLP
ncbi:MAG: DUF3472 domain-containing protein [Isosphaeraceae bacterium]